MPYDYADKIKAARYVAEIRAKTFCPCGRQPVEWHHEDHLKNPNKRIAHLVALGFPISVIQEEIDRCEALCRRCHMQLDGRLDALINNRPFKKGDIQPLKICKICNQPAKPLRRGRCNRCNYQYLAKQGL